ncbi:MAG: hypothetical protein ACOZQL_25735 [Myxococcota bacterium]
MSLSLVTLCLALVADEPMPVEKSAAITREQEKAQAEVSAKYGNKKSSELSQDERRQMIREQIEADKKVLDKYGVSAKDWARESIRKDRDQYASQKQAEKALAEKEKAQAEAAKKDPGAKEIQVQKGFSDENPVTVDEKAGEDGKVAVEQGLPPGANEDQDAASEQDRLEKSGPASDDAPKAAKPSGGGKSGKGSKGGKRR